jgi:hypothetical protein
MQIFLSGLINGGYLMSAGTHNIVIEQGATFKARLRLTSQIIEEEFLLRGQIRKRFSDEEKLAEFEFEYDEDDTGPYVDMILHSDSSSAIHADPARDHTKRNTLLCYDVEMVLPNRVIRLLEGTVTLSPEVTR